VWRAFTFGPAWHGAQSAVWFRTDRDIDSMISELARMLEPSDFILLRQLTGSNEVRYAGWLVDDEAFRELFPGAIEASLPIAF
jgi:hypothetical protein